jgi:transcription antitermination factor NusG
MSWYVLCTKPRTEKRVADSLRTLGIKVFFPLLTEVRQWSDRKKKVQVPLFKSYVFIKIEDSRRNEVFDIPGVVRYMYWLGKPALVRDSEIEVIKQWLERDEVDEMEVQHLSEGDQVTLRNGAFKNQPAIIKDIGKRRTRLILPHLNCTVQVTTRDVIE